MAKDGTNRGGRRVRAGDKPDALADKILNGKAARVLAVPELKSVELDAHELTGTPDLCGADMPTPSEYLSAKQRDGRPLGADALFHETWQWLVARGCEKFVNPRLLEAYAQASRRIPVYRICLGSAIDRTPLSERRPYSAPSARTV